MAKETQPLLPGKPLSSTKHPSLCSEMARDEFKHLINLAYPVILTYVLEFVPGIVSVVLVGHIDSPYAKDYLDASALAVMYVNLTGLSIGFGLATAMDTLCSQAFGSGKLKNLGIYLQTGFIVLTIAFIPIFFANYYCTELLIVLNQPPLVSKLAGQFARYTLFGLPFLFAYELLKKVLQGMNIVKPMLYVAIIGNIINIILGYLLVYHTSLGFDGAAVARSISSVFFPLILIPYLHYSQTWNIFWCGLNIRKSFQGIGEFVRLGVSGMMMMCFEWWAFEVLALFSGWLPNAVVALGANSVLLNIVAFAFMFYLGFSVAANVRIGNALGANSPGRARLAAFIAIGLSFLWAVISGTIMYTTRFELPKLVTNDPEIIALASQVMIIGAGFQIFDGLNAAVQGTFRGAGLQTLGAQLNFVAYYIIGLPLGGILSLHFHYGLMGLWGGITTGLCTVAIFGLFLVMRMDWKKLAEEARIRTNKQTP